MTKNLKKQLFPKEYAQELLRIADGDFASVRRYHEGDSPLTKEEIEASLIVAKNISVWARAIISA